MDKFNTKNLLKFIKYTLIILLVIVLILSFPQIKNIVKDNLEIKFIKFILELLNSYRKEQNLIFYILNAIILIAIYDYFVSDENKKQNKNKFLIKSINRIQNSLDELQVSLKQNLQIDEVKKINLLMKKITYTLDVLNNLIKTDEFKNLKKTFENFKLSLLQSISEKNDSEILNFKREIVNLENSCFKIESEIL